MCVLSIKVPIGKSLETYLMILVCIYKQELALNNYTGFYAIELNSTNLLDMK